MRMNIPQLSRWAQVAAFVERWVLSSVYLALLGFQLNALLRPELAPNYAELAHVALMLILNAFIAAALLLSRRPTSPPERFRDIGIPLVTSFFFVLYSAAPPLLAQELLISVLPADWQTAATSLGLGLGLIGPLIALWGVGCLGRSFGVFVTVRQVVLRGPYRYVRHPMYLGYICILLGLLLIQTSVAFLVLIPIHIYLFAYRATLEEERLARISAEYREQMKHTGFLLPRLW
jgi:protein-S-isoprenylcysteine O-methyltransferase Ste14